MKMKRLFAILLCMTMLLSAVPLASNADSPVGKQMKVIGGWLRLRNAPSFSADTITSYYTGSVVTVQAVSGKWYRVLTEDNRDGWMYSSYLTLASGGPFVNIAATVTSANGKGVKLRTGPSTAYGVIAVYPVGTQATILTEGTYWDYIRIGTRTGYMMKQFLVTGGYVPPVGQLAYVTSSNGYGVRLRSGPGYHYGIIGLYSVGTQVTVLKHGNGWDYISVGTRQGYMKSEFLLYANTQITAASLSSNKPMVGDTLTVQTVPAGATVQCRWLVDNAVAEGQTGMSFTVTHDMVGKKISCEVTGTGLYTGKVMTTQTQPVLSGYALVKVEIGNLHPDIDDLLTAHVDPQDATYVVFWLRCSGSVVTQIGQGPTYRVTAADVGTDVTVFCEVVGTGHYAGQVVYSENVVIDGAHAMALLAEMTATATPAPTAAPTEAATPAPTATGAPTAAPTPVVTATPEPTPTTTPENEATATPDADDITTPTDLK